MIIKRALISCYDKTGLEVLAKALTERGVELIASQGTAAALSRHGIKSKTVEAFAGIVEQLDGRVKTLHPKIHGGILARRDDPAHLKAVGPDGLIDLVIVNLYPFEKTSQRPGVTLEDVVEEIDIGGVALLRAAAKNFAHVGVISDPKQYPRVLEALGKGRRPSLPADVCRALGAEAFALTSRYDQLIAAYMSRTDEAASALADLITVRAQPFQPMRYGENPHQEAGWYVPVGSKGGLTSLVQVHGKPLSYNNLLDLDTAVRCLADFDRPTCVIIKHASPCGIATAAGIEAAYQGAHEADAESAFGGIIGLNRPLDKATAEIMSARFLEVVVAPAIARDAREAFAKKPNVRLIELKDWPRPSSALEWRSVLGGWLIQQQDDSIGEPKRMKVVTKRHPTPQERRDLWFAWIAAKHVRSNAIVLAKDEATVGIGQGQPSRVRAVRLAIQNAGAKADGVVLASDGFFPFPDNVESAAQAGVTALIQPGGSIKDAEVIAAADAAGLAMIVTGIRHFRH